MSDPVPPPGTPATGRGHVEGDASTAEQAASSVQSESRELAASAAEEARSVGQTAQQQATRVAGEARRQAQGLLSSAASSVEHQAEEEVHKLADVLRSAGTQTQALADGQPEEAGHLDRYVAELAGTLSDIALRIERLGARGSIDELQQFARRRPGVFLGGAAAAGFLATRFLRNARDDAADSGGERVQQREPLPETPAGPARPVAPPTAPPPSWPSAAEDAPPGQNRGGPTTRTVADAGPEVR